MIRKCEESDLEVIFNNINDGAQAYKGVIPADCWHEPYMLWATIEREPKVTGVAPWKWR